MPLPGKNPKDKPANRAVEPAETASNEDAETGGKLLPKEPPKVEGSEQVGSPETKVSSAYLEGLETGVLDAGKAQVDSENPWDRLYADDERPPVIDRAGHAVDSGHPGYVGQPPDRTPNEAYTVAGVLSNTKAAEADFAARRGDLRHQAK